MNVGVDLNGAVWFTSSYSQGDGGQCVACSRTFADAGLVPVRDSKAPEGPALVYASAGWSAFLRAVGNGRLFG
ncbi:DUF397 domain-containing protein [Streptomyces millisiae]|uniref:DUF397 domain-containing protein n=1 Tax=Streptomyces millisiae TaxID=3075542 RepID=A0ABU2LTB8_9ACTN|nr:DUF397 domain-containing protein [Streptomyces sp. DSM 44918]MDT0320841.1 DUF397 domain-containing protein [Streptomyces sp. DSM 44918]